MLGIVGERLWGEMGVSSNSVTGVSGTTGGFLGFSSGRALLTLSCFEGTEDGFEARLCRPLWSGPW